MGLTIAEEKKYDRFCEFFKKNIIIDLVDGDHVSGKLIDIESPLDVEPDYPLFILRKTPETPYLTGIYLNQIKDIREF